MKRIYILCADGKFVTATFWLGKPFCPLPFLSDCWVTISVVMEWNGMEWKRIWHTRIGHNYGRPGARIGWRLSLSLSRGDDDDVILPSYPHRHTRTFVPCLHTSSAACYTGLRRLAVVVVTVVDGTVCGDWLTIGGRSTWIPARIPWLATWTRRMWPRQQPPSTRQRRLHLWIRGIYVRRDLSPRYRIGPTRTRNTEHGGSAACDWVQLLARTDTDTAGPNRAHDRPPSRTTKTATLYTNPATSWQIDVRDHVNTLIVVDLRKPQVN